ncbi:MAG TPA: DnaT-like ssDNA-binding protein [Oscillospiraceae bacterium]|nr:DnaT-like ssDNA-binding protein [Oscillospiraceae bacterium]
MPEEFETTITVGENSYIDIDGADEYFAGRLHAESWGQADDETKEKALKQATKEIDRQLLKGRKATDTQELAFPRYPDTEVPVAVKDACCEIALALLERGNSQRRKLQQEGVQSFTLGNMSETYTAGAGRGLISQEAKELLKLWLLGGVFIT